MIEWQVKNRSIFHMTCLSLPICSNDLIKLLLVDAFMKYFCDKIIVLNGGDFVENKKYSVAGTDIEAMLEQARKSGLSYNEAKEWIARETGGRDTHIYRSEERRVGKE